MDIEQARFNMIEQQIRPWEVLEPTVLEAMSSIPREVFVPENFKQLAFSDTQIPLGHDEVMLEPRIIGRLLQALNISQNDDILEIGTGSAWLTALLAKLGHHVWSIDREISFTRQAESKLNQLCIENVTLETADIFDNYQSQTQYDVIVVTGSIPLSTSLFQELLKINGRLFVVTGSTPLMEAQCITRTSAETWTTENLFETHIPMLKGAPEPEAFVF
ncbi:protein-L-isoaspartate O-methyltransferase family protein [Candidatus Venteria ishoeyi]|uniref:Protein-L-isoaspartate O-methyltransferase n=1 Tax=Candidatus Venteria ishoeyi TaxID=1899563 RepID=A0A1H6FES6_9GAMM|nr:protein-L-isoaspartate O-methyltransferase [Candidatus Venteria ishoeyi]SEH07535.1 Protein-L-isoaspartate O-methyltransferase [Candidatus Venteria ishoeyi]